MLFTVLVNIIFGVSVDCLLVIELAKTLLMDIINPLMMSTIEEDCCASVAGTCNGSNRVVKIAWQSMGLNGTINGDLIPATVTSLLLKYNGITGSIPTNLPSGLLFLYLSGNALTGTVPALPANLLELGLAGNRLYGDIPEMPTTLHYVYLGPGNGLSGSLRLFRPIEIFLPDNYFTDVVVQDTSILIGTCDISGNPLLGNVNINNLIAISCVANGLYNSSLLPFTISTFLRATSKEFSYSTTTVQYRLPSSESDMFILTSSIHFDFATTTASLLSHSIQIRLSPTDVMLLGIIFRSVLDFTLLGYLLYKTPFKRELLNKFKKTKKTERSILA